MDMTEITTALTTAGLGSLAPSLTPLLRPSLRLAARATDENQIPVGASKLGGLPDLPAGAAWPVWKNVPMSFICQIKLADAHPFDTEQALPATGLLSFFYDATQQAFGGDPADRGGWSVVYTSDAGAKLQRLPAPPSLPANARFHACAVTYSSEMTAPQQPTLDAPTLTWTPDDETHYEAFLANLVPAAERATPRHRLLGHPDTIQDDMRQECQLAANGVNVDNAGDDARTADLLKGALQWRLLLQVDSDAQAGMGWGSNGMLYYWIDAAALKAANFSTVWLVLQSE